MLRKFALLACFVVVVSFAVSQQTQPTPPATDSKTSTFATIPPEAVNTPNPVKPTAASLADGKKFYGYDCAMCHGENGDGKGEVAVAEGFNLKDFRDPNTLKDRTDGELFYILKKGKGHMPKEPIKISVNELWNLINYIRSMSKPAK